MDATHNIKGGPRLVTVNQLVELPGYDWATGRSMRHYIFNAEPRQTSRGEVIPGNGLAAAIIRIGRKILIDLDEFDAWIDRQRATGPFSSTSIVEREFDRREVGVVEAEAPNGAKANRPKGSAEVT